MLRTVVLTEFRQTIIIIHIVSVYLLYSCLHIYPKILQYLPSIFIKCLAEKAAIEYNLLQRIVLKMFSYGIYKQSKDLIAFCWYHTIIVIFICSV